eukprot:Hpha_TRINITY_DN15317_c0_g14::TRINITY_DN15317_c0_g14_i1::g.89542::m.89542
MLTFVFVTPFLRSHQNIVAGARAVRRSPPSRVARSMSLSLFPSLPLSSGSVCSPCPPNSFVPVVLSRVTPFSLMCRDILAPSPQGGWALLTVCGTGRPHPPPHPPLLLRVVVVVALGRAPCVAVDRFPPPPPLTMPGSSRTYARCERGELVFESLISSTFLDVDCFPP